MSYREDGNLLGRIIAVAVIGAAAYGVRSISCGAPACPAVRGSCCFALSAAKDAPAPAPAPADKPE